MSGYVNMIVALVTQHSHSKTTELQGQSIHKIIHSYLMATSQPIPRLSSPSTPSTNSPLCYNPASLYALIFAHTRICTQESRGCWGYHSVVDLSAKREGERHKAYQTAKPIFPNDSLQMFCPVLLFQINAFPVLTHDVDSDDVVNDVGAS